MCAAVHMYTWEHAILIPHQSSLLSFPASVEGNRNTPVISVVYKTSGIYPPTNSSQYQYYMYMYILYSTKSMIIIFIFIASQQTIMSG